MAEEFWWASLPVTLTDRNLATRSVIDVRQDPSGTSVLRVYTIYLGSLGLQGTPTPSMTTFIVGRISSAAQVGNLAPVPMKPTNSVLPTSITCGTSRTYSETAIFRQILKNIGPFDTSATPADSITEWSFDIPLALMWGTPKVDSNVQPLTARAGEGIHLRQTAAISINSQAGYPMDADMEFSVSST